MITVKRAGKSQFKKAQTAIENIHNSEVHIGWFGTTDKFGVYDAYKAFVNEFGSVKTEAKSSELDEVIPPRPFILNHLDEVKPTERFKGLDIERLSSKIRVNRIFNSIGDDIKEVILNGIEAQNTELAPYTIEKRRQRGNFNEKPLVDTGSMAEHLTRKLVKRTTDNPF